MEKRWVLQKEPNFDVLEELIEKVGVSRPVATILGQRKIENFEQAKSFFRPDLEKLHDPFEMKNMNAAVDRIEKAVANGENILVYGDYDVDGTTAVALVYEYLTKDYEQVGYYIPDRYKEGYGLSKTGIEFASDNSFTLIIALDCGIKAIEQIAFAKTEGIDVIVCDHHKPGDQLPEAIILNPKQKGCEYPFKELCGCGVGFKLIQALNHSRMLPYDEVLPALDMVLVAIGADIVPIVGENRILAHFGLKRLNENPRIGFKKLLELANKKHYLSVQDVVFTLAPRINAAGRIESGNQAVELLLARTEQQVDEISVLINEHNEKRKELDRQITAEALDIIENNQWLKNAKSTVVYNSNWHKGVVGIVASRLTETYYRPTIVLTESHGFAVGSARSVKGFNIYNAIDACSDLLHQFGGHDFAAGMTLPIENVDAFRAKFDEVVQEQISREQLVPSIEVATKIDFRDIYESERRGIPKFFRILKQIAPFGPENLNPNFLTERVRDRGSRILKDEHIKFQVFQEEYEDIVLDGIGFSLAEKFHIIQDGEFDIVYSLEENHWNGNVSLQMMVKDIKPSKPVL
ncbi:MAG: single-stranded-DNA-specific exonuclease RecJ [Crocinitomicaceae bacterium]|nr:single-stranded-DNA-specific exonuclease RecJ [Crocinitomicaceae bacterium]